MIDELSSKEDDLNLRIGKKIRLEREKRGWSLSDLAIHSGVSRAMIHKIERGACSATATKLAGLAGAFGMSMSQLMALSEPRRGRFIPRAQQPVWQDPETGYTRRHLSPSDLPADIISVELPAGASVPMPAISYLSRRQLIWVTEGSLHFHEGETLFRMSRGDCLELGTPADCIFENPGPTTCHYTVMVFRSM